MGKVSFDFVTLGELYREGRSEKEFTVHCSESRVSRVDMEGSGMRKGKRR